MALDLFDFGTPIAHASDPDTSHAAARTTTLSGARSRHAKRVLDLVTASPDSTAVELWETASDEDRADLGEMQRIRQRLTDLLHKGLVARGPARLCRVRGTTQTTWRAA